MKELYLRKRHNGKPVRVHRLLMEDKLKRKLKKDEHIHHINGDKHDNRIENLELLTNSLHQIIEYAKGTLGIAKYNKKRQEDRLKFSNKHIKICINCGKKFSLTDKKYKDFAIKAFLSLKTCGCRYGKK